MKTVNGILELIQEYGSECKDNYYSKSTTAHLKILRTSIEELHRDAARYQWLTTNAYVGIAPHPKPHEVWCLRLPNPSNCANLDAAIDAAMEST